MKLDNLKNNSHGFFLFSYYYNYHNISIIPWNVVMMYSALFYSRKNLTTSITNRDRKPYGYLERTNRIVAVGVSHVRITSTRTCGAEYTRPCAKIYIRLLLTTTDTTTHTTAIPYAMPPHIPTVARISTTAIPQLF